MNKHTISKVLEKPLISEKSTNSAELHKTFVFKVQKKSNKLQIKQAIELMFDVKVNSVHVLNIKGKSKRFGRSIGKRSDWKKAYVKLKPGFDIEYSIN